MAAPANIHHVQGVVSELACLLICRPEEGSVLRCIAHCGSVNVFKNHLLQIVPHGDLSRLASLLIEVKHPLFAGMIEAAAGSCRQ